MTQVMETTSRRMGAIGEIMRPVIRFFTESAYARAGHLPGSAIFAVGDPQELPRPEFTAALQRWSVPQNKDWFAYKNNEPEAQQAIAAALRERRGLEVVPETICVTNGAFAGIAVSLAAVTDPGDEVIFISPPWFFYEALIAAQGAVPVRVRIDPQTFDLDLDAISAALSPRTRAIIVNSPNNPTGRIYPPETLKALARLLTDASARNGRPIYILSDEAYSRIVYDGRDCPSPAAYYPQSFVIYTYGKTLLTPGQRLGYVALPASMPDRDSVYQALFGAQIMTGYAFANASLQHALPDLERLSIDVQRLQRRRDRLVGALRDIGYQVHVPEGTFYLLPRSPWADDWAFVEHLARHQVYCLPGCVTEMPGYFRISLTASDEMVERALPVFEAAFRASPPA